MSPDTLEIREFYSNYEPPRYILPAVKELLYSVPAKYLIGLDSVVLTNQSDQSRRFRRGKVTRRGRSVRQSEALGRYHHGGRSGRTPWIEIYVDSLVAGMKGRGWVPLIRDACLAYVLFHEIGHHIDATVLPEYREKEDVADSWRSNLMGNFIRRKYSWLAPIRKPVHLVLTAWLNLD